MTIQGWHINDGVCDTVVNFAGTKRCTDWEVAGTAWKMWWWKIWSILWSTDRVGE